MGKALWSVPHFALPQVCSSGQSILAAAALCRRAGAGAEGQRGAMVCPASPRSGMAHGTGGNVPGFGRSLSPPGSTSSRGRAGERLRSAVPPHLVKPPTPDAGSVAGKHGRGFGLNVELTKTSLSSKAQPERALPRVLIMQRVSSRGD